MCGEDRETTESEGALGSHMDLLAFKEFLSPGHLAEVQVALFDLMGEHAMRDGPGHETPRKSTSRVLADSSYVDTSSPNRTWTSPAPISSAARARSNV